MRYRTEDDRLRRLEAALSEGTITTTDGAGRRAWLEGSGLSLAFRLMTIQDEGGVIPDDLRREAGLWSRAEVREEHGTAAIAVQELCRAITQNDGE
ncbi:MAG: hypothetical protein PHN90_13150 [Methanothrix sp.]|nr:hypothetical protein [Methanothrix sp.]